jgi:hypothetical protein
VRIAKASALFVFATRRDKIRMRALAVERQKFVRAPKRLQRGTKSQIGAIPRGALISHAVFVAQSPAAKCVFSLY